MFKIFIPIGVTIALISGCKNTSSHDNNLKANQIGSVIECHKTTLNEAILYLGDPVFIAVTGKGKQIAGFNLENRAFTDDYSNNVIQGTISFGQKITMIPKITKNVFLELDDDNVVTDVKFSGAAWVEKKNFFVKNEARIKLTQDEIFNKNEFTSEYIYNRYQKLISDNLNNNNRLSEKDSLFDNCEYKCQLYKNAQDLYGTLYKSQTDHSRLLP